MNRGAKLARLKPAAVLIFAALAGTAPIFWRVKPPFLWTFLLWTAVAFAGAVTLQRKGRAVLVNFAIITLTLAGFEAHLWFEERATISKQPEAIYSKNYFVPDELLGYRAAKGIVGRATKYYRNQLIYDVRYTIAADGLRISPPVTEKEHGCILFFGDSMTVGEGVQDDQTMPYQVGVLTHGNYRIYNFGFHGYGPHQMLAMLQTGRVDRIIRCRPSQIIYQAILAHIERVAGLTTWDKHGPRYILTQKREVRLAGHFDDDPWNRWLDGWLTYESLFGRRRAAGRDALALYAEIVAETGRFIERHYPEAEFHVLLWDDPKMATRNQVIEALQLKHQQIHRITEILPGYVSNHAQYELSEFDHHPNPTAHRLIAQYVVDNILVNHK